MATKPPSHQATEPPPLGNLAIASEELRASIKPGDHVVGITLELEDGAIESLIFDAGTKQKCEAIARGPVHQIPWRPIRRARWFIYEITDEPSAIPLKPGGFAERLH